MEKILGVRHALDFLRGAGRHQSGIILSVSNRGNMTIGTIETVALLALALIGSWLGGFFGTYFKKKGENLATKEDIEELTRRTKEIEAKIDDQVWDRQRQWELTRDGAIRLMEAQGKLDEANALVERACDRHASVIDQETAQKEWIATQRVVLAAIGFLRFACWGDETSYALTDYQVELDFVHEPPKFGFVHEIYAKTMTFEHKFLELRNALRKELRLKDIEKNFLVTVPQRKAEEMARARDGGQNL